MSKPNVLENYVPLSGQYSLQKDLRLNAWLFATTVVYLFALFLNKAHPGWSPATRGGLMLLPVAPALLYVRAWVRLVRGMDELQRGIQLAAFLFAALGTVLVSVVIATLNAAGLDLGATLRSGLGLGGTFFVMFPLWLVGTALANCRYQ
jgi:ACR3 family arsenite efflux pump ArsB